MPAFEFKHSRGTFRVKTKINKKHAEFLMELIWSVTKRESKL